MIISSGLLLYQLGDTAVELPQEVENIYKLDIVRGQIIDVDNLDQPKIEEEQINSCSKIEVKNE